MRIKMEVANLRTLVSFWNVIDPKPSFDHLRANVCFFASRRQIPLAAKYSERALTADTKRVDHKIKSRPWVAISLSSKEHPQCSCVL